MNLVEYKLKAKVWVYPRQAAWHFVSVPPKETAEIKQIFQGLSRGFGSFPVTVTIGTTSWKTSVFPDNKTKTFLLPIKVLVRKKEQILAGTKIEFKLKFKDL